jgi:hypothetical protein
MIEISEYWIGTIGFIAFVLFIVVAAFVALTHSNAKEWEARAKQRKQALDDIKAIDPALFEVFHYETWGDKVWDYSRLERIGKAARTKNQRQMYADELKAALAELKEARK